MKTIYYSVLALLGATSLSAQALPPSSTLPRGDEKLNNDYINVGTHGYGSWRTVAPRERIAAGPAGTVPTAQVAYVTYMDTINGIETIEFRRSTNGGYSWSAPTSLYSLVAGEVVDTNETRIVASEHDVFIVFASTNPDLGRWGINAFCIPADTPGLRVGPNRPKMGMRTTPFANLRFTDCFVPEAARMGAEGSGASIFTASMEAERGFLLVGSLGALERVLDDTVEYARTRKQFGEAIGSFQGVSHQLSEVKLAHEAARLLMYKAAVLHERGTSSMLAAALSKLAGSEAALKGTLAAVEIHGARGYVTEFGVERDLRNLSGGVIYGGASGIQKNIIARLLGLPA